jgi:nucleotide-binding universal stress UspA family protein
MQTIITPVDFSDISINALNYAADMAMNLNANLLVLHAIGLPVEVNKYSDEFTAVEIEAEQKLNNLKKDLLNRTNNKIFVQTKQVVGSIENELIKMCSYKNPLAVVMATQGANMKEHFFLESITVFLSKNLKYPVIVVPPDVHYIPVTKILLATDLENLSDFPVDGVINITAAFNARVDIVHVYKNEDKFDVMMSRMAQLTGYLKKIDPQFHFIYNKNIYSGITDFAEQNNSNIILTVPKKHALFHSSKSKQLIFNAPFTVMAMH